MSSLGRLRISREGWYYLVVTAFVAGGAVMRQINLLMLLFGMLAGPFLVNLWSVWTILRPLRVSRRIPDMIVAGDPLTVELTIEHLGKRGHAWSVVVEDRLTPATTLGAARPAGDRHEPAVLFTHVPPHGTRLGAYTGRISRRGRYTLGPLRLSTRFPFGLLQFTVPQEAPGELLVAPSIHPLSPAWRRLWDASVADDQQRRHALQRGLQEGDFHAIRPWESGDSIRWIHWRTTARQGEIMVRQFERPWQHHVVLLIELRTTNHGDGRDVESREAAERALSFAASVLNDVCRAGGCDVLLAIAGAKLDVVRGPASLGLFRDALRICALAEPSPAADLQAAFETIATQTRSGSRLIVVTAGKSDVKLDDTAHRKDDDRRRAGLLARAVQLDADEATLEQYWLRPPAEAAAT